jgi:WD40-like Beta Propeller Repeat
MRWARIVLVALVVMPATSCGSSGSGAGGGSVTAGSAQPAASSTTVEEASSTAASTSQVSSMTTSSSTVPTAASTSGAVAVWDMCTVVGPMQIVDPDSGAQIAMVGLQGGPSWSPDGRRIGTVDHFDGMVKVADVAAGEVDVVADLQIGPYPTGDSCGTFEQVGWSPDGASLLLQYGGSYGDDIVVRVVRVDGSEDRILFEQPQLPGVNWQLAARWLPDGEVMIAYLVSDVEGDIAVQRGDPWGSWPSSPISVHRPDSPTCTRRRSHLPVTASPSP